MVTSDDKIEICKLLKEILDHTYNTSDTKMIYYEDILYGINCMNDDLVNEKLRRLKPDE